MEDTTPTTSTDANYGLLRKLSIKNANILSRKTITENETPTNEFLKAKSNSTLGRSNYTKFKVQPKKIMTKMINDKYDTKNEIPIDPGDMLYDNINSLIALLQRDQTKRKKDLDSLIKNFHNLTKGYKKAIERKYKQISLEISKFILNKNHELLLHSEVNCFGNVNELISQVNTWIKQWQRDQSNFDYQFNFFKSRLNAIHHELSKSLPDLNIEQLKLDTENDTQTIFIKQSLQFLTGITFENTVPLSESQVIRQLTKLQDIRCSVSSSKIIESNQQKDKFIQKILLDNNYDSITPIWEWDSKNENNLSVEEFHQRWDNKGPVLLLVKTDSSCIFGGVSPQGFESINNYAGSEYAFLFSFATSTRRRPIIWKVKPELAPFAVKNNESKYSPGFGQSNKSDLFISFKTLGKSYSCVGNVYEFPEFDDPANVGFDTPETFFTGTESNWKITNIEAFSLGEK